MFGITEAVMSEIEIKKSRFITHLIPITDEKDAKEKIEQMRKEYPGATHYCYAYILFNEKKCSDDGEPAKTAGQPILNVLEKQHLHYVLALVIRYFGGIKLGAGGLVRAYSNATIDCIKQATIKPLLLKQHIQVSFPYDLEQTILKQYPNFEITHKTYLEQITYEGYIDEEDIKSLSLLSKVQVQQFETSYRIQKGWH